MSNRGKFSRNRQGNRTKMNNNSNKAQKDDDTCSVVCYKNSDNGHVDVIRARQQILCSPCNSMRGTLLLYCKHILDNNHRDKVKKLCDDKCFTPTIYEQAIHLAFHNNFCYQSEKFHFLYKNPNEEPNTTILQTKPSAIPDESAAEKMEINNNQQKPTTPTNVLQAKSIQVTLVFQDKKYSKTGTAVEQIREQLLKDMVADRAVDIAALPADVYYAKKNFASDDIYCNIQNSSIIFNMAEEQSQVMLKQQQEPLKHGDMSFAEMSRSVEQTTAITTHEISTAEKIDVDDHSLGVDDVMNVCKDVLNKIVVDVYSKCDEAKREREFLFGTGRRRYKKRKAFFCDICCELQNTEDSCTEHRNGPEHLEKIRHYQIEFLPWRRAMQESLITGKSMKEIMGTSAYDNYKATMARYLAPNSVHIYSRFCCAYCECVFPDQWSLEKHLHSDEHKTKQTSVDHKELVPHFADVIMLPNIYKLNGMKDISEVPEEIRKEQEWSCVTRKQLDDDTNVFLQKYPFDQLEAASPLINNKAARKRKPFPGSLSTQKSRNSNGATRHQQAKRGGLNRTGRGQFQTSAAHRGGAGKRTFPTTSLPNKRFRTDLNNSFPGANRSSGSMRNYNMNQYNYGQSTPYDNGNDRWSSQYPVNQQRPEFYNPPNVDLRSQQSNNNGYLGRPPPQLMSGVNNFDNGHHSQFNGANGGYTNQQTNYNPSFNRAIGNDINNYHPEPNSSLFNGPPNRSNHRASLGSTNASMHSFSNNHQHSQQPFMNQVRHQQPNSFGSFAVNNSNNTHSSFFPSSDNQQQNQMGANGPPVHSYADYQASSGLTTSNIHAPMYPSLQNTPNSLASQSRSFDGFGPVAFPQGSANPFGRSSGSSTFTNDQSRYDTYGHPSQMGQSSQAPRHNPSGSVNNPRGRGRGGGARFQLAKQQPASTFSYSSSSNNNNSPMRGRGTGRNFGSRR